MRDVPHALDAGDLDGDGDLDLVVANVGAGTVAAPSAHVSVLRGNGTGHFEAANVSVGCQPSGVAIADLTADAGQELGVACIGPAIVRIFSYAGGGLTQVGSDHPACEDSPVGLAAGNFDGLGKADLAVTCLRPWFAVLGSDGGFAPLPGPNHTAASPSRCSTSSASRGSREPPLPRGRRREQRRIRRRAHDGHPERGGDHRRRPGERRFLPETGVAGRDSGGQRVPDRSRAGGRDRGRRERGRQARSRRGGRQPDRDPVRDHARPRRAHGHGRRARGTTRRRSAPS